MKISNLLNILQKSIHAYGDVRVQLMNEETGDWWPVKEVIKLHPYTGQHGCLNRAEPVNAIGMCRSGRNAPDLVIDDTPADIGQIRYQLQWLDNGEWRPLYLVDKYDTYAVEGDSIDELINTDYDWYFGENSGQIILDGINSGKYQIVKYKTTIEELGVITKL